MEQCAIQDRRLALSDGRVLAFTVQGPAHGYPVFYLHGIPGSRYEPLLPAALAPPTLESPDACRLIALDRPGYGESSPCASYDLTDHGADIAAVADHLGLDRFALLGFSGGGVFALASAAALGNRIDRLVLVATPAIDLMNNPIAHAGDLNGAIWQQAQDNPASLPEQLIPLAADGHGLAQRMINALGSADRKLLTTPENMQIYFTNMVTAVRQGARLAAISIARDVTAMMQPWGFDVGDLKQPVYLFHGTEDNLLPTCHGQKLTESIVNSHLELGTGWGHYGGIYGAVAEHLLRCALPSSNA
jgi:pimeloyl-ACP methyl ester carboxylesterase